MSTKPVLEVDPCVAPNRLSASSTLTVEQCPAKFYFNKIAKLPDYPSKESALGNFVHEALEQLYILPPVERTILNAKDILRGLWESKWVNETASLGLSDVEIKSWRWQAFWCVEELFKMESPPEMVFEGLESRVAGKIGGVEFLGFVDRYHREGDALVVGDYKTGKHDPRFVDDKKFQMAVYAILGEQTFGEKVSYAELIFLKSGDIYRVETDAALRATAEEKVRSVAERLDEHCSTGKFLTNKTRLCDWCSYKSVCPAWSKKKA